MPRPLFFALLSLLLFVGIALPAAHHQLLPGEELVYRAIRARRSPLLDHFFHTITKAGGDMILIPIGVGVFLWQFNNWRLLLFIVFYSLGVPLLETGAKLVVARPRPHHYLAVGPLLQSSHGFPSGHALAAAAFYGMLLVLLYKEIRHRGWQQVILWGILLLIVFIGLSRIYLGVHWPSDVLGGYALGGAYCFLAKVACERIERSGRFRLPSQLSITGGGNSVSENSP